MQNIMIADEEMLINTTQTYFNVLEIQNRRFMLNPKTGTLILGRQYYSEEIISNHAEEHGRMKTNEPYDDFIRGWIGTGSEYPSGVIHFTPPTPKGSPEMFDKAFTVLEVFAQNGADNETIVRGFPDEWEQPLENIINSEKIKKYQNKRERNMADNNETINQGQEAAAHGNYRTLMIFAPEVIEGKYDFIRFQAGDPDMWITFQALYAYENNYTLTLYYNQKNGLTINDTDMRLVIDKEKYTVNAETLVQHPNIRNEVTSGEKGKRLQYELNNFLSEWLINIEQQGYKPIEARLSLNESQDLTDYTVYFNSERKPFNLAYMHDNSGNITVYNRLDESGKNGMKEIAGINAVALSFYENDLPAAVEKLIEEKASEKYKTKNIEPASYLRVPSSDDVRGTFEEIERFYPSYEGILPDPTIGLAERNEYGYTYDGLLPLNRERALELFDDGYEIFLLTTDNAEGAVDERGDILNYDGIFGIEVESWELALEREAIENENKNIETFDDIDIVLPDSRISFSERDLYGYKAIDILPLLKDRAAELFDVDHTVYMLYSDGTEAMVFERGEISSHDGIFGIDVAEWIASKEYAGMVKDMDSGEASKEAALIFGNEDAYAIYQLKHNNETRNYRFEPLERLESKGLSVERKNYTLVYHAPLNEGDTPDSLYEKFNIDHPAHFTGHSLSVSDVIVIQNGGAIMSYYIDDFGFKELPAFLGNEYSVDYESADYQLRRTGDLLQEHISNHLSAGYLTQSEERLLQDNIDMLGEKMTAITNLYDNGMPLDVETDTIDRLFREELEKSNGKDTEITSNQKSVHNSGSKKPSILLQLNENLKTVAQDKPPIANETQEKKKEADING